jgi:hypothetical protein
MIPLLIIVAGGLLIGVATRRTRSRAVAPAIAGLTLAAAIWASGTALLWAVVAGAAGAVLLGWVGPRRT